MFHYRLPAGCCLIDIAYLNQMNAAMRSLAEQNRQLQANNVRISSTVNNRKGVKKVDKFTQTKLDLPSCSVCFEEYSFSSDPRVLSCGHSFCSHCISQMRLHYKRCPLCKEPNDFAIMQRPNFLAKELLQYFKPCGKNTMTHSQRRQKVRDLQLRLSKENFVPRGRYSSFDVVARAHGLRWPEPSTHLSAFSPAGTSSPGTPDTQDTLEEVD